jgi:subtilisin family serine protease
MLLIAGLSVSQNVYKTYQDGKIWFKLKDNQPIVKKKDDNPLNLTVNHLPFLQKVVGGNQITRFYKPFFAMTHDEAMQRTYQLNFTDIYNVDKIIAALKTCPEIEYAEKVPYDEVCLTPNDYSSSQQWYLAQINATSAWNYFSTGSTRRIAIVDNAVQVTHTDLSANVWVNAGEVANNNIDDDGNGYIDDINGYDVADLDNDPNPPNTSFGHGTHCAGDASASTNNSTGISAIGFSTKIIGVKATSNSGNAQSISNGYEGVSYAAAAGAHVISLSWGGSSSSGTAQNVINAAYNAPSKPVILAAAGNSNVNTMFYPAAYTNVLSVASSTTGDVKSSFSNYGTWIDITAPGSNIYSTVPNNTFASMSGTSMACPLTAGLVGLMRSLAPTMTQSQIISCLTSTCININSQNPNYVGQLGAGRIDANAAMACVNSSLSNPPAAAFAANNTSICPGQQVQFTDQSAGATSWAWTFAGGTPASSTAQNPLITYNTPGTYTVTLVATNSNGSSTATQTNYITVSSTGQAPPFTEGFQNTQFLPTGWSSLDAAPTGIFWTRNTTVGGFNTSTACAMFDNYASDAQGSRDEMRSLKLDFSTLSTCTLRFDVAYARYGLYNNVMYSDSLAIYISTNCVQSWTQVYLNGGTNLSTNGGVDVQNTMFVPTASQWRTESVSLNSYIGQQSVIVAVQNRGRYGQALYVDNINLQYTTITVGSPELTDEWTINLFPNPSNGNINLAMDLVNQDNYTIEITNAIGQVVYTEALNSYIGSYNKTINLTANNKGVYFVTVRSSNKQFVKRIVLM